MTSHQLAKILLANLDLPIATIAHGHAEFRVSDFPSNPRVAIVSASQLSGYCEHVMIGTIHPWRGSSSWTLCEYIDGKDDDA